jgi:hypothetical protein
MKFRKYYGLILGLTVLVTDQLFAWKIALINETDGDTVTRVTYTDPTICSEQSKMLSKGEHGAIDTGPCCPHDIFVESHGGKAKGCWYKLIPPRAGTNMTCANFTVRIHNTADNKIIAEAHVD